MWFRFPSPIVLEVSGKDSPRYLNSRLTNDVRQCVPGSPVIAAILNPQGRVEGVFSVHATSAASYLLACEAGSREDVRAAFCRYLVADRVTVQDRSDDFVLYHVAMPSSDLAPRAHAVERRRLSDEGRDVVVELMHSEVFEDALRASGSQELSRDRFDLERLRYGSVVYPDEVNQDVILTECGLKDLVSFSKGCYVGQEVIERSDAIGRLPRKLERIRFSGGVPSEKGAVVANESGESVGKLITVVVDEGSGDCLAFALLRTGKYQPGDRLVSCGIDGRVV